MAMIVNGAGKKSAEGVELAYRTSSCHESGRAWGSKVGPICIRSEVFWPAPQIGASAVLSNLFPDSQTSTSQRAQSPLIKDMEFTLHHIIGIPIKFEV